MKKVFAVLAVIMFTAGLAFAGDTVTAPTDTPETIWGDPAYAPSGVYDYDGGKSYSLSGNVINISSGAATAVYALGAINTVDSSGSLTNNSVIINNFINMGVVCGAYAEGGGIRDLTLTGNSVSITNTQITAHSDPYVAGADLFEAKNAAANNNTVNLTNVKTKNVYGAKIVTTATGSNVTANNNSVNLTGNTSVTEKVYGVYVDMQQPGNTTANNNIVNINTSASIALNVFGADATNEIGSITANYNEVNIESGSIGGNVYGASAVSNALFGDGTAKATAVGNKVTITGGSVGGNVVGGFAKTIPEDNNSGEANAQNNTVTITGGSISGNVFGGYSVNIDNGGAVKGSAINNTVNLGSGVNVSSVVYGGFVDNSLMYLIPAAGMDARTGNTLNVTGKDITVKNVANFENYNFVITEDMSDFNAVLTVTGTDETNISNSNIHITVDGALGLNAGEEITLITRAPAGLVATDINSKSYALDPNGMARLYEFDIYASVGRHLRAIYAGDKTNPETKILSEGAAAGAIMATMAVDNISGSMLDNIADDGLAAFGAVFGGSEEHDIGSSVEMSAFGLAAGIAKKFNAVNAGVFVEYTDGSFDTESNGAKGDGTASAIGGGLLAKKNIGESTYIEGLVRAGSVSNDYKAKVSGHNGDFDYSSMYFGFALGGGKTFAATDKIGVEVLGKYMLTSIGGSDANLSTGEKYDFDSVLSNRIKVGAKGEYKVNEMIRPFVSVAYDYEISGDVDATIDSLEIDAPSLNGGTFIAGLGANMQMSKTISLEANANLLSGTRSGVNGKLQAKWQF